MESQRFPGRDKEQIITGSYLVGRDVNVFIHIHKLAHYMLGTVSGRKLQVSRINELAETLLFPLDIYKITSEIKIPRLILKARRKHVKVICK